MNLPINIDDILRGRRVEWERLEFKTGWNPQATLRTLCAFANDFNNLGGGYLVLGVEEQNGRPILPPVGLAAESLDRIQKEVVELGHRMDFLELCRRMNIVDGPDEFVRPKNVGLMFFNEHPERFYPQTQIDVVHFPDGPGAEPGRTGVRERMSERILQEVCLNPNITIAELAKITGVTTRSVERNIRKWQASGELARVGADRGGYWEVLK